MSDKDDERYVKPGTKIGFVNTPISQRFASNTWNNIAQAVTLRDRREAFVEGDEWVQRVALVMQEEKAPPVPVHIPFDPNSFPTFLSKLDKLPSKLIQFEQTITRRTKSVYIVPSSTPGKPTDYVPGIVAPNRMTLIMSCWKCKQRVEVKLTEPIPGIPGVYLYGLIKELLGPAGCPICADSPNLARYLESIRMVS